MGRIFQPARLQNSSGVFEVQSMRYDAAETFIKGACVVEASDGEIVECGADPASILGVSLAAVNSYPGYEVANDNLVTVRTGVTQEIPIVIANRATIFSGRGVNGGTDPVTPLQTHIGEQYGVVKVGSEWVIDVSDTTALRVEVVDITEALGPKVGFFLFKFLEAILARP